MFPSWISIQLPLTSRRGTVLSMTTPLATWNKSIFWLGDPLNLYFLLEIYILILDICQNAIDIQSRNCCCQWPPPDKPEYIFGLKTILPIAFQTIIKKSNKRLKHTLKNENLLFTKEILSKHLPLKSIPFSWPKVNKQ